MCNRNPIILNLLDVRDLVVANASAHGVSGRVRACVRGASAVRARERACVGPVLFVRRVVSRVPEPFGCFYCAGARGGSSLD